MVAGHLHEKNGYYYIILNLTDMAGKRKPKWIATGLPVKGNKKRAEQLLIEARRQYDPICKPQEILFADYMEQWLEVAKSTVSVVTYSSYSNQVKSIIAPYFRKKKITLEALCAKDIQDFYAAPEAVAYIAVQKFVMGSPLYRQEQEWNRQGLMLSRQTMSNWLIYCSDNWGLPVYLALKAEEMKHDLLHADETELQVLHETNRTAQQKSYMWLYRTSGDAEHPIVLYDYAPGRGQEYPNAFLEGFHGYLQTDGYSGYHGLKGVTHVGCWARARRKFDEACRAMPKGKRSPTAEQGVAYCTQLFELEKEFRDLTPEERKKQRLERGKPILDAMLAWANTRNAAPKSALGKALTYLKNQWPYLNSYLLDGRIELSNNRAERSIKPFVISRKNFLFANTARGAKSSAVIFSLIETAKENGLDPYRYLTWVFTEAPRLSQSDPGWASKLLPWNAPETCQPAK